MPTITPGARVTSLISRASMALHNGALAARTAWNTPFSAGSGVVPTSFPDEQDRGPRQYAFPVGYNMSYKPREGDTADTSTSTLTFTQLRELSRGYYMARICINRRISILLGQEWTIGLKAGGHAGTHQPEIEALIRFWERPNGKDPFAIWLQRIMRDMLEIDALCFYPEFTRGGIDGRKTLLALREVDGATIKPLIHPLLGYVVGYQQIVYGSPRSGYDRPGVDDGDSIVAQYKQNELFYMPRNTSTDSPYGTPPIEWIVVNATTAIRKQLFELAYFTDGSEASLYAMPKGQTMTPQQIADFEKYYLALMQGNDALRNGPKWLPMASEFYEPRSYHTDRQHDEDLARACIAAYDLTPQQVGFTDKVNRSSAGTQENIAEISERGDARFFKTLFDYIIQSPMFLNCPWAEWQWKPSGIVEDRLATAQTHKIYLDEGVIYPFETRAAEFPDLKGPPPNPTSVLSYLLAEAKSQPPARPDKVDPTKVPPDQRQVTEPPTDEPAAGYVSGNPESASPSRVAPADPLMAARLSILQLVHEGSVLEEAATSMLKALNQQAVQRAGIEKFEVTNPYASDSLCLEFVGKVFAADDFEHMPPYHYNCKCDIRPVAADATGTDLSRTGEGQLPQTDLLPYAERSERY